MHDFIKYLYVGHTMMNDEDIKEYHDLDKLKDYKPLPYGLVIADSGINGQGLFTTRKLVRGTHLGEYITEWMVNWLELLWVVLLIIPMNPIALDLKLELNLTMINGPLRSLKILKKEKN